MSVNKVILLGVLGKNPEIRMSQNGTQVGSFSLATSENWKDKNSGEKKQKTEWHNIVAFGNVCKVLDFLEKGSKVYLEGKITTEKYTDNKGVDKYSTKIIADNIQVLKGKEKGENKQTIPSQQIEAEEEIVDDEITF